MNDRSRFEDYLSPRQYARKINKQGAPSTPEYSSYQSANHERTESARLMLRALPLLDKYVDPSPVEIYRHFRLPFVDPSFVTKVVRGWPLHSCERRLYSRGELMGKEPLSFVITENRKFSYASVHSERGAFRLVFGVNRLTEENIRNFSIDNDDGLEPRGFLNDPKLVHASLQSLLAEAGIDFPRDAPDSARP